MVEESVRTEEAKDREGRGRRWDEKEKNRGAVFITTRDTYNKMDRVIHLLPWRGLGNPL